MQICAALVGERVRARAFRGLHRRLGNAGIHAQEELHLGRVIATVGTVADAEKHVSETRLGIVWFRRFPSSIMDRPGSDGLTGKIIDLAGEHPAQKAPPGRGLSRDEMWDRQNPRGPSLQRRVSELGRHGAYVGKRTDGHMEFH